VLGSTSAGGPYRLGALFFTLPPQAAPNGLPVAQGVYLTFVQPGSPAASAGAGDVISSFDGNSILTSADPEVAAATQGKTVRLKGFRGGSRMIWEVTL